MVDIDVEKFIIKKNSTLIEAMNVITKNHQGIGFICQGRKLEAVLSDGDIRRWLVGAGSLDDKAESAANNKPIYVNVGEEERGELLLEKYFCGAIPVLDFDGNIICVIVAEIYNNEHKNKNKLNIPVVIMAGGQGSRLRPYTDVLPKPLLPIGEKTIIERVIDNFKEQGCDYYSIIVNFKKNLIKTYMEGLDTDYGWKIYEENEFLGTAGGLKLLENDIKDTFILSNCDVLVNSSYFDLVKKHKENDNIISVVCAKKKVVIPYGVIDVNDKNMAVGLREKPEYNIIVNTGIYVVEPDVISDIPSNTFIHITDVMKKYIDKGANVGTYIVDEQDWLDMGQFSEMRHMKEVLLQ